jgi:hypothetical protein
MNSPKTANLTVLYPSDSSHTKATPRHTGHTHPEPPPNLNPSSFSDADLLLNFHSSYPGNAASPPFPQQSFVNSHSPGLLQVETASNTFQYGQEHNHYYGSNYGSMMIESQDLDISSILGDDQMWLEYLPNDLMNSFDPGGGEG